MVSGESSIRTAYMKPNVDELVFKHVPANHDSQASLLKAGEIDTIPYVQTLQTYLKMRNDSAITLYKSPGGSTTMACLFFNCRVAPFNNAATRKALSCLVNRKFIAEDLLNSLATPQDSFISKSLNEWVNSNATAPEYDPLQALSLLYDEDYIWNNQTKTLVNGKDGVPLRELTLLTPQIWEAQGLWIAGDYTAWLMSGYGIPVKHLALNETELIPRLIETRDFDMCVYDFDFGSTPFNLYGLLHSSMDTPLTPAYSGIHDSKLDKALDGLWYGLTKPESMIHAHEAQQSLAELMPYVPIYSMSRLTAISSEWSGAINIQGLGVVNRYTYTQLHRVDEPYGGVFVQPMETELKSLNPLLFDVNQTMRNRVLNLIYLPLLEVDPSSTQEAPVLAKEWETEAWTSNTTKAGMKITFKLVDSVLWQDGKPFTSEDVRFCIEYLQAHRIPQYLNIWSNLVKVETPDKTTVNIYLNDTGYRHLYAFSGMTFLPEHIWKNVSDYKMFRPWEEPNPSVKGLTKLIGQGPFVYLGGNLNEYVRLVWNPLFYIDNPGKPGLVEVASAPKTATVGDKVTFSYRVRNQTRALLNDVNIAFTLLVKNTNGSSVIEQQALYQNNAYKVNIDTAKLGQGNYSCIFTAYPYGVNATWLTVKLPTASPSSGVPGFLPLDTTLGIVVAIIVVYMYPRSIREKIKNL